MPVYVPDILVVVVFVVDWRQSLGRCVARIPVYLLYSGCVRVPGDSSFVRTNLGVRTPFSANLVWGKELSPGTRTQC
jgi:hypothetical protein